MTPGRLSGFVTENGKKAFFRDYFPGISGGEMLDPVEKPVLP